VARQRVSSAGDKEASDFIRRQQQQQQSQQVAEKEWERFTKSQAVGSSPLALETELMQYLLKSGHKYFHLREGREVVDVNVAQEIIENLEGDNISLENKVYNDIFDIYRKCWHEQGVGVEVPVRLFINHEDTDISNMAVDILTSEDNYVVSQIWSKKEVHVESEEELLAVGVNKAIMLYRSKVIDKMIEDYCHKLDSDELSEEVRDEYLKQVSRLNRIKTKIAKQSKRIVM
jgi:DNA primase